jgi:hypothetical protein
MSLRSALFSSLNMGPGRHSLRLAARKPAANLVTDRSLVTPDGCSKISRANLKCLGSQYAKSDTDEDNVSCTSEEKSATEEFNLGEHTVKLDGIKRKLTFCQKSLIMNDLGTHKVRTTVKLEPMADPGRESRASLRTKSSRSRAADREGQKVQPDVKYQEITVNGEVKQVKLEPKDEPVDSPSLQHTEMEESVMRELVKQERPRRKNVQTNVFPRTRKVKVGKEEVKEEPQDAEKQAAPQVTSRRKRKVSEPVSAWAPPERADSTRKQETQDAGLELVSVRPDGAAELASGETLYCTKQESYWKTSCSVEYPKSYSLACLFPLYHDGGWDPGVSH